MTIGIEGLDWERKSLAVCAKDRGGRRLKDHFTGHRGAHRRTESIEEEGKEEERP
jgi:hypothetical protein